ncbi:hypothetical protein [Pelagicoccus mobilis]|uniref:Endo-polygalacturonase n=1 Tax=Pelagicoccus mobilis TaxID=415221 RepID=A0A934VTP7_9BACT|nr:hypothetical protein [Pelagicoccus mobilis]MBK1880295.1 hypothetical protein [Pelagicoccus mobilis]
MSQLPLNLTSLIVFLFCFGAPLQAGIVTYPKAKGPLSSGLIESELYTVTVTQNQESHSPFVHQSNARTEGPGTQWVKGRAVSWTDFDLSGTATVEVRWNGKTLIPEGVQASVYPARHNIEASVFENKIRFQIPGEGHYVLTIGNDGFDHALCIFANPFSPTTRLPPPSANVLYPQKGNNLDLQKQLEGVAELIFEPGIYQLGGEVVLPSSVRRVHIQGGAVVYGSFHINHDHVTIDGRGLLSGLYMKHKEDHMIETPSSVGFTVVDGITISDFPYFAVRLLGHDNTIRNVKTVGPWVYNADGFVAWERSTMRDSFIMANDDAIKVYDNNVSIKDCVIWNLQNGACLQLGWSSLDASNIHVDGIDVIRTEWRPESNAANNGVINLRLSKGGENIQSNLTFQNIRVDTPVLRIFDLRMDGMGPNRPANRHRFHNATFRNIDAKMLDLPGNPNNQNFIIPFNEEYGFKNLVFENLSINGTPITDENATTDGRFLIDPLSRDEVKFTQTQ